MADREESELSAAIQALRARALPVASGDPLVEQWLDDMCLHRYLRARDMDLIKAERLLVASMEWRFQSYKPHLIDRTEVDGVINLGTLYRNGKDRHHRPIMHIKPGGINPFPVDLRVKSMMYALEEAVASMEPAVEAWVWVLDFSDYANRARSPDGMKVAKTCLSMLQDNYPERLGLAFIINCPWYISLLFTLLSPFMSASTKAKLKFVNGNAQKLNAQLTEYIDDENLELCYGGKREEGHLVEPDALEAKKKQASSPATEPAKRKKKKKAKATAVDAELSSEPSQS